MLVKSTQAGTLTCPLRTAPTVLYRSDYQSYLQATAINGYIPSNGAIIGVAQVGEQPCRGKHCAMWREAADGLGYCGLAGQPINLKALFSEGS